MICDVLGVVQYLSKKGPRQRPLVLYFEEFRVTLVNENVGNRAETK